MVEKERQDRRTAKWAAARDQYESGVCVDDVATFLSVTRDHLVRTVRRDRWSVSPFAEERLLAGFGHRIRDVREGPDGYIYLLLDEDDEPIWRMEPLP